MTISSGKAELDIEFNIPQNLKDQGIEGFRIHAENAILKVIDGPLILFPFYIDNYSKSIDKLRSKLEVYNVNEQLAEFYCIKITELLLSQLDTKTGKQKRIDMEEEQTKKETQFIIDSIDRLRKEYKDIPYGVWEMERQKRFDNLRSVVQEKIPKVWESIELTLTVKGIRRIEDVTLPLVAIIIGNPGNFKTLGMETPRRWPDVCYKDKINPKSWVTHASVEDKKELESIDLIREMKDKILIVPELAPIFMQNEEILLDTLSTLTRLADGNGFISHSGLHGTRGVDCNLMFTMLGATVYVPQRVYKVMTTLGPKIYFYNTDFHQATKEEIKASLKGEKHESKKRAIQDALFSYMLWLEVCPSLIEIKSGNLEAAISDTNDDIDSDDKESKSRYRVINRVITWEQDKDDEYTFDKITELALFLAKLRGNAYTYQTKMSAKLESTKKSSEASDDVFDEMQSKYEYSYEEPIEEEARRAGQILYNVARSHAFELCGRNYIKDDDLIIPIKFALSAANRLRVKIIKLVLQARNTNGTFVHQLDTNYIMSATRSSKSSVHKTMKELEILGLVEIGKVTGSSHEHYIELKEEFQWAHDKRFQALLEKAYPSPYYGYYLKQQQEQEEKEPEGQDE
jgi:hypothetical protein